jgi:hypothetical protein
MRSHITTLKLSLLTNLFLAGLLVWFARAEFKKGPSIPAEEAKTETTCDVIVRDNTQSDIEPFTGAPAVVNFDSLPEARQYQTAITREVEEGANFAGHYRLATWGCGTDCYGFAIIDLLTGKISDYQPVYPFVSTTGFSSSATSNILVFNPRRNEEQEIKSSVELVKTESSAATGRVYSKMTDSGDLQTICVENYYAE